MLNLTQGRCYSIEDAISDNPIFTESACDSPTPVIQVVKRIDGDSNRSLCPEDAKVVSCQSPARLYCLQPLKN